MYGEEGKRIGLGTIQEGEMVCMIESTGNVDEPEFDFGDREESEQFYGVVPVTSQIIPWKDFMNYM